MKCISCKFWGYAAYQQGGIVMQDCALLGSGTRNDLVRIVDDVYGVTVQTHMDFGCNGYEAFRS